MPTLDPDTQKYYEEYFATFATPGWHQLMKDLDEALKGDQLTAVQRCKTNDEWQFERGNQLRTLKLLTFETILRDQYDQLTQDDDEDEDLLEGTVEQGLITE